jgi:hypothetical protein
MVPSPSIEGGLCGPQRSCGSHNRHHVCQLGKPLYHHQDGITPLWFRQTCDEVYAHTMPWPRRVRKRLQEAALLLVRGSVHLAFHPSLYKVGYIIFYARPKVPIRHHSMVVFPPLWPEMGLWYFSLNTNNHTRIIWALLPMMPQVMGVTPRSPLCPWCFGHSLWRGARQRFSNFKFSLGLY